MDGNSEAAFRNKMSKEERRMLFEQKVREEEAALAAAAKAKAEEEEAELRRQQSSLEMRWVYDPIKNQWTQTYVNEPQPTNNFYEQPTNKISNKFNYHLTNLSLSDSHLNDLKQAIDHLGNKTAHNLSSPSPASPFYTKPKQSQSPQLKKTLPPNWKCKKNKDGRIYYYNIKTNKTQWNFPSSTNEMSKEYETNRDNSPNAISSTTNNDLKAYKEKFREGLSKFIVKLLEPYLKSERGRIQNVDDFKHLARKFTHVIMEKELSRTGRIEELEMNKRVRAKTQEYVSRFMSGFPDGYCRKAELSMSQVKVD